VETIAPAIGFTSSVAVDSTGTIYYTSTSGSIYRLDGANSVPVATLPTVSQGDAGLLGMALINDRTAAVHYTNPELTREVVSRVDLVSGHETKLAEFAADITNPSRPVSLEHHGGNVTVAPDGSIFFAIGDFGGGAIAADPAWPAGKIWRIWPDGRTEMFARGVRNSYDMAWDDERQRLVAGDNGPVQGDEINFIRKGDYLGWPYTFGNQEPVPGAEAPTYVFRETVAPTGIVKLNDTNRVLRGYLLGGFVTSAIYWIPDPEVRPLPDPIALIEKEKKLVIDVTQAPNGDIIFCTFDSIHRLILPEPGDCNGDGLRNALDVSAINAELEEGFAQQVQNVHRGDHRSSLGCDANGDLLVDWRDQELIAQFGVPRLRAVRSR
jgi:glucose/arabinose dehydrogenase